MLSHKKLSQSFQKFYLVLIWDFHPLIAVERRIYDKLELKFPPRQSTKYLLLPR